MKKQYGIRMTGEVAAKVENFAEIHKMSGTAAAEFFVKLGIESLTKDERLEARIDILEEHLKLVYRSLAKSSIYLAMLQPADQAKAQKAEDQAAVAVSKIFGD